MIGLTQWWREVNGFEQRWLLLGKGPSFELRKRYNLKPYRAIAINHVVREMPVEAASAVNFSVVEDCGAEIYRNARYLLMPRHPHTICGEAPLPLEAYFDRYPVLADLDREGRLVWYNLSCDPLEKGEPVVQNASFSVCILLNLLGAMGVRQIRSLGVDGGLAYGASFQDIAGRTRLANGMATYDHQAADMLHAIRRYDLQFAPLNPNCRLRWLLLRRRMRCHPRRTVKRLLAALLPQPTQPEFGTRVMPERANLSFMSAQREQK